MDKIGVEECGLMHINENYVIYRFCLNNNIRTINELIELYEKNGIESKNEISRSEVTGFVELLRYKYLGEDINIDEILHQKFDLNPNVTFRNWYKYDLFNENYGHPLRRLGLTADEAGCLKYFVEKSHYISSLINVIFKYRENNLGVRINNSFSQKIFLEKLDIIVNYYRNKYMNQEYIYDIKVKRVETLLLKYELLNLMRDKLNNEIDSLKNNINLNFSNLNEKDINKLVKKHNFKR